MRRFSRRRAVGGEKAEHGARGKLGVVRRERGASGGPRGTVPVAHGEPDLRGRKRVQNSRTLSNKRVSRRADLVHFFSEG